jgi:hypothetical protein
VRVLKGVLSFTAVRIARLKNMGITKSRITSRWIFRERLLDTR